ncbi:hypothetical protein QBC37DRAFT_317608 [Rhypophila decipiens]|uniref:Uncharacterized protein n=1 Tax=Rhypophila decipiens TaxID=261697 RepID=A0AAN7B7C3_9PEZI|nr:hypothetical protein QBC37DRAFT_317608 [Rhypophila decipiens]
MRIRHNIRRLFSAAFQSDWVWEVSATCLSVTTIGNTAIAVSFLKGRPLPQWPLGITPNALLSIYAVIFKASASFVLQSCVGQLHWTWFKSHPRPLADVSLYDAAGRGAWGSVMWLYTFHIRNPLVTLAALITVVSIAVDPSFQQIIRFSDCPDQVLAAAAAQSTGGPDRSLATTPRTNYVKFYDDSQPARFSLNAPAQSSLNAGVFTPVEPLTVNCPTGNCTFDIFHTAGYCSTCDDVSTNLQFDYQCSDSDADEEWVPVECNSTNIKSVGTAISSYLTHIEGSTSSMIWNSSYWSGDSNNGLDPLTGNPVEDTTCHQTWANTGWRCRGYGAANCMMYPCVRCYNASVQNGVVSQLETHHTTLELLNPLPYWNSSHEDYGHGSRDFVILDVDCLLPAEKAELMREGYNLVLDTDSRWLAYNPAHPLNLSAPVSSDAPYPASMFAPKRQFTYVFDSKIEYQLSSFFTQSYFMIGNAKGAPIPSFSARAAQVRLNTIFGSRELQALYNSTDISLEGIQSIFDNIASSFTAYVRKTGHPDYSTPAFGTAFHYAVCLEPNRPWITLPSILAAGILILLPMTIIISTKKGVPIWKSSNMPLAFRGPLVDTEEQQSGRPLTSTFISTKDIIPLLDLPSPSTEKLVHIDDTLSTMEKEAKKTTVQLEQVEGKSRLVLVEISED